MKVTKNTTDRHATRTGRATRRALMAGVLALVAPAIACKARPEAKAAAPAAAVDTAETSLEPQPEPVAPAPAPVAAAPVEEMRRRCDEYTIRDTGIGAVVVDDPQSELRTRCVVLADSTATDGTDGMVRGTVVVGVNGTPMSVQIAEGKVYRVTVTDPQFRTLDGLGPGTPVAGMLDLPGAVVLEGEHDLSVVVNAHCGLYFRITKPATLPANAARWSDVVRAMPQGTPVERVVVHSCHGLRVL